MWIQKNPPWWRVIKKESTQTGIRTQDQLVKSQLLFHEAMGNRDLRESGDKSGDGLRALSIVTGAVIGVASPPRRLAGS